MREMRGHQDNAQEMASFAARLEDIRVLFELAQDENDTSSLDDSLEEALSLRASLHRAEVKALLGGEADECDCFVEIHAGAGGTEAQDWAAMLLRMYIRWAQAHNMKPEMISEQSGEEAGLKSASVLIKGLYAFGWLKSESGVHRLVRISPFDSNARRHTSFASVWVYPQIDDNITIEINESDCRIDTYRASGAGGQHINKTDSAVRITHLPTSIVVQCQNDRSQHRNRAQAWDMLRARLYEKTLQEREADKKVQESNKAEIGWGSQIRSYVMQPYQLVKDYRTNVQNSDVNGILDGDLDGFLEAALALN